MKNLFFLFLLILICFNISESVQGQINTVMFRNGGIIDGTAQEQTSESGDCQISLPNGIRLVVPEELVKKKTNFSDSRLQHGQQMPLSNDSIDSHLKMAQWCKDSGLGDLANKHYQRILEIDPNHEEVHRLLQHVKMDGVWMTAKEQLESRGYVRYQGKLLTTQELELVKHRDENKEAQTLLAKQIRQYYQTAKNGNVQAREALMHIKSPLALAPFTELLKKEDNVNLRSFLVRLIGGLGTPAALSDLATVALQDNDPETRLSAVEQIKKKSLALPAAAQYFEKALLTDNNEQINRAAVALGVLETKQSIPDLITVLITEHKRTITIGSSQMGGSFSSDGKMQSFSPGGNVQTKIITDRVENGRVLESLKRIVAANYPVTPVDFRFDVLAWRNWFQKEQKTEYYTSGRSY